VPESVSSCSAASPASRRKIKAAFDRVRADLKLKPAIDWHEGLYQTANRIAHLHFLRSINRIPAQLIFVNFTGDHTQTKTSRGEFEGAKNLANKLLGLSRNRLQRFVRHVYIDVSRIKKP